MLRRSGVDVTNIGRRPCPVDGVDNRIVAALSIESMTEAIGKNNKFDGLIHLAASGVNPGSRDPLDLIEVNAALAPKIVMLAADLGCRAVVIAGSSAEYHAPQTDVPLVEDAPLEMQKLYGATKAAGSILALASGAAISLPVAIGRLFNVFGPGEAPHRLLPSLATNLRAGQPVRLSAGTQVRDFIYVDDACTGLIALAEALSEHRMPSGAYNLATGTGHSVAQFARTVASAIDADESLLQLGALPMRADDLPYVVGNPDRLKQACGWSAATTLIDGIRRTLDELERTS
ncbi:NAD-dependent epimerase/dehydratase family protein [Trinickia sp. LjRoot230]